MSDLFHRRQYRRCDGCLLWYHFACTGINNDVVNQDTWICSNCHQKVQQSGQLIEEEKLVDIDTDDQMDSRLLQQTDEVLEKSRSVVHKSKGIRKSNSVSSTVSRRTALALQRLEEERKLLEDREVEARQRQQARDQEYLNQKYSILEDDTMSNLSFDDQEVDRFESIRQWNDNVIIPSNSLNVDRETNENETQLKTPQLNSTIVNQQTTWLV